MERLDLSLYTNKILRFEHMARYSIAYDLVRGEVKDCACGIGFGSSFLSKNSAVSRVSASDVSEEAINYAKSNYISDKISFQINDIRNVNEEELDRFDSFVCFETLEHIPNPEKALESIEKVLKKDGLFLGSVPSRLYDDICEANFGKNEYHVTRFDYQSLVNLLTKKFKHIRIFGSELSFDSHLYDFKSDLAKVVNYSPESKGENDVYGSYFFIASNSKVRFEETKMDTGGNLIIKGLNYIELFNELHLPVRESFLNSEDMVRQRDEYICHLENEIERVKADFEEKIKNYKLAYENDHKLLVERIEYIEMLEEKLSGNQ